MLVDTSVWVDHFRRGNKLLQERLHGGDVWTHPFVIGELACGQLRRRSEILTLMAALPSTPLVDHHVAMALVESRRLAGQGIGWIDVHLLASAMLACVPVWVLCPSSHDPPAAWSQQHVDHAARLRLLERVGFRRRFSAWRRRPPASSASPGPG